MGGGAVLSVLKLPLFSSPGTYTAQGSVSICRVMLSDQCLRRCYPPLPVGASRCHPFLRWESQGDIIKGELKPQCRCANSWLRALCPDAQPLSEGSGGCKRRETLCIPGCPSRFPKTGLLGQGQAHVSKLSNAASTQTPKTAGGGSVRSSAASRVLQLQPNFELVLGFLFCLGSARMDRIQPDLRPPPCPSMGGSANDQWLSFKRKAAGDR